MADGDLAYSHVTADSGALLCQHGGGSLLHRQTHIYWRIRFDFSCDSGYDDVPELYEWIPPGMVRDSAGHYHLEWDVATPRGFLVQTGGDPPTDCDFSAEDFEETFTIHSDGTVNTNVSTSTYTRFAISRGGGSATGSIQVNIRHADVGSSVYSPSIPCAFPEVGSAPPFTIIGTAPGPRNGAENFHVAVTLTALPHRPDCPHQ